MKELSQKLKNNSTRAELLLWYRIKDRNLNRYKFRRQHVIGPYIVDFVCLQRKLIIELDGGHHALQEKYDLSRTSYLEAKGFRVLRFWNNVLFNEIENVLQTILTALEQ